MKNKRFFQIRFPGKVPPDKSNAALTKRMKQLGLKKRHFFVQFLILTHKQIFQNNNSSSKCFSGQGGCSFTTLREQFSSKAKKTCAQCPKLIENKFFQTLGFLKCSARHVECRFNKAADTTSTKGRNFLVQGPILRNKQVFRTTILPQTFPLDKDIAVSTSLPEVLRYISKNFTLNDRKKIRCQFFYKKDRFFLQNLLFTSKM